MILDWTSFSSQILVGEEARIHRCHTNPFIDFFYQGINNRLGLMVQIGEADQISDSLTRLETIQIEKIRREPDWYVSVSIDKTELFQVFYSLLCQLAQKVIVNHKEPLPALLREISSLESLLKKKATLSLEKQIGLFGELTVLQRILENDVSVGVDCWTGPNRDSHDFRLKGKELEVKTALSTQRIHTIHGFRQLFPSGGHELALVSVLLAHAPQGDGHSIPELVGLIDRIVSARGFPADHFQDRLDAMGYNYEHAQLYAARYVLRQSLSFIPIGEGFPRITLELIQHGLGEEAARVQTVQYDLNVEGLGHEQGQDGFPAFLGSAGE
jgi:hypothetical protein